MSSKSTSLSIPKATILKQLTVHSLVVIPSHFLQFLLNLFVQKIIVILYFRRPSATLRLRLLGNSSSSLPPGKAAKPGDKGELSRLWQQLKTDIEAAMAKKPASERSALDQTGPGAGQYKRFSVIRREVGVIPFQTDLFLAFYKIDCIYQDLNSRWLHMICVHVCF